MNIQILALILETTPWNTQKQPISPSYQPNTCPLLTKALSILYQPNSPSQIFDCDATDNDLWS